MLWLPIEQVIPRTATVLVAPYGPLWGLPWGALPGGKHRHFLVEERTIGCLTAWNHATP